jgi:hypothetical protein
MDLKFETEYKTILEKLDEIDPVKYARTRNYVDGEVTCLRRIFQEALSVLNKCWKLF